ncbi:hypothetical protein A4X06_0g7985 [Tilletia controversa]|uniref:Uncharacterized protein n=2 Tax=Tilletia TaxID=13289 RepID=A0A8X7STH0_9BASI|nr:hypothetical protein CF336_g7620 [Tilletia laevis]KAE8184922.1 hypothetical protein CF328_g7707 [Tilletia controversa]KAE8185867.1 hypothetical protein CF335_g7606 [Tilletia laevis]KAE8239899.1 hypothetical protein A4X06_0g7985 [Tilletia controversa]KAE8247533.1 hypothetical protein A4X03_0g7025 [Tilletia caries]
MLFPRVLLISPFLLLATLANSAPLPNPPGRSSPTLSPTSSLEARSGTSSSSGAAGDPWSPVLQGFIDRYTRLRDQLVEAALQDFSSMSFEQKAAFRKLVSQTDSAGAQIERIAGIIAKVKDARP